MIQHQPVLLKEVIQYLQPQSNQNFIDCTINGGGHSFAILEKIAPAGKILGLDIDQSMIDALKKKIAGAFPQERLIAAQANYKDLKRMMEKYQFGPVQGILLDLGFSAAQLSPLRGFSFQQEGTLDMRYDQTQQLTAAEIINSWPKEKLIQIFRQYGEEKMAERIAQKIIAMRRQQRILTTLQLSNLILDVSGRRHAKIHPATKIFQALRIAVNQELENLEAVLPQAVEILARGGRLAVISFHSLEDRIVKQFFKKETRLRIITKKPIRPAIDEIEDNPRSRSAKMRVAEKLSF